ncbi:aspartylglucosaminidase-like protein [Emericellopsis atlantica]|uniref:Aspartylglucosaminidase-like protein n=1 Tax=Emericellopsis atlantica TaxID=2614577 RepID=A0A9P8CS14_9HYPO|nr:aspartylglucosaminidase-like protein [Emericellopsis atlantica]KAG9257579.1 aspartylglucosaminidase-like protein [Emericellopsis atlantica]
MDQCHHVKVPSSTPNTQLGTDGALDRMLRLRHRSRQVPAIFIHAGAGFHSHQNESSHLQACVAAASMGMRFLQAGASATQAVEASLRILEDKDITNAGYGSNLSIDGTVECDATVVDHLGRSGACGAVPGIRNPISLAKLILDMSNLPLSLHRVPPNALVGEGARMFAVENGMATYANEHLVSRNARDRFLRWKEDLHHTEGRSRPSASQGRGTVSALDAPESQPAASPVFPGDHDAAVEAGTWNEGQPDSPYNEMPISNNSHPEGAAATADSRVPNPSVASASRSQSHASSDRPRPISIEELPRSQSESKKREATPQSTFSSIAQQPGEPRGIKRPASSTDEAPSARYGLPPLSHADDLITDTVGAIAIDDRGYIAAGSSSGGIGMKHRGRLGPAALVGIGTAVVPCDPDDEEAVSVATVISGTGEHMATTMASQRCAERIYHGTRKGSGGKDVPEDDDDVIMESFIADDFMNHTGVKNCHSAGAIGVMTVKKTRSGYYFYFAHNTDSFALASMGGNDKRPVCTMSRLSQGAEITRGGRKIRLD